MSHRSTSTVTGYRALVAVLALATLAPVGCGGGDATSSSTTETDEVDPWGSGTVVTLDTDQVAVALEVPEGWTLEPQPERGNDCPGVVRSRVTGPEPDGELLVEAIPSSCETNGGRAGNGDHGTYRTIDDVSGPDDVRSVPTPIGPATRFVQDYYECTNECSYSTDTAVIVELDDPVDPAYPTLVVLATEESVDDATFDRIVAGLHRP